MEDPAPVAYLRFVEDAEGRGLRGCMFVVSLQGDPLELCFTRVDLLNGPLWNLDLALAPGGRRADQGTVPGLQSSARRGILPVRRDPKGSVFAVHRRPGAGVPGLGRSPQ